nr:integrase, catalytic region, zinc finger, CCHC-type, peptidase aspartic, catalytic [Tanacetum cinerariifolium]
MSTQQDIYVAGSEIRPPMLNKENYIPWSSRLLRYAKSRPNGKLIHNSILNGPYVRKMIPEPGDANRDINIIKTSHLQTDDELSDKELKQIEADDQAIQTMLLGLPEDIYAAVDSYETAQEIWLRVQQMMKGSDIGIQEKKAKLFNEWESQSGVDMKLSFIKLRTCTRLITLNWNRNQNQIGNGNLVAARAEGNAAEQNRNQIRCYNCRGIVGKTNALSKPVTSNSVSSSQEPKGVNNDKVIAPGMFRINPSKTFRNKKHMLNTVSASVRTKPITVSQTHSITKKDVNSNLNGLSSTGVDNTKTRRPKPRSNTKHDRVPSASKRSRSKNKAVEIEEHHRNLLLSKNNKHISSACNNSNIDYQDVISKVVCAMCKKCLISVNHDKFLRIYVNGKIPRGKKQTAKVSFKEIQMKYRLKVSKPKNVGTHESLATPKPSKSRFILRWSPTGKLFDTGGCSKHMTGNLKLLINFVWKFMGTVRFGNDHVAAILGFGDLQWGIILITRVYFVEGLGHNLFLVGQFYDSDLEVAFRRDAYFVRNLKGVDLLKGDLSTNLYTINLHEMASASPICLKARASSTKLWLWHQRLSHLNFDTINDLSKNDLVTGLPKFKYHKEHLCPSCEQGKSKRASHPPKPVPNSR